MLPSPTCEEFPDLPTSPACDGFPDLLPSPACDGFPDLPPYPTCEEFPDLLPSPAGGRGAGGEGALEGAVKAASIPLNPAAHPGFKPRPPTPIPANKLAFARELRQQQTDAEQLIWGLLRNRRLKNAKFRRQYPIGTYILDFYCAEHDLAIELDGGQHGEHAAYDTKRDQWLSSQGLRVLRFWNNQVLQETEAVLTAIWNALPEEIALPQTKTPSPPAPLPLAGEGGKTSGLMGQAKHKAHFPSAREVSKAKAPSPPTPLPPAGEGSKPA